MSLLMPHGVGLRSAQPSDSHHSAETAQKGEESEASKPQQLDQRRSSTGDLAVTRSKARAFGALMGAKPPYPHRHDIC